MKRSRNHENEHDDSTYFESFYETISDMNKGISPRSLIFNFMMVDENGKRSLHSCNRYSDKLWECASVYDFLYLLAKMCVRKNFTVHNDECVLEWEYDAQDHIGRESEDDVEFYTITVPVLKTFFAAHAKRCYMDAGDEIPANVKFIFNINTTYLGM